MSMGGMTDGAPPPGIAERAREIDMRIDTTKAHPARVYDVFLGGKTNYPADREAAKAAMAVNPRGRLDVRHNRDFMRRAVGYVAGEAGIRQFLDVGTGIPTSPNLHEIAQAVAPESRIVYVDNDPIVLTHARALLTSSAEGTTDYLEADIGDSDTILREAARTLDFTQPVALVLAAVLHFVQDDVAYDVVEQLVEPLPSGSHVVLSHLTADMNPAEITRTAEVMEKRGFTFVLRPQAEVLRFLTDNGLETIDPGIVPTHRWRPDGRAQTGETLNVDQEYIDSLDDIDKIRYLDLNDVTDADINIYGVVARKP